MGSLALVTVATVDVWSTQDQFAGTPTVSISSSTDGVTFSAPVTVNLGWTTAGTPAGSRTASVDVSSLPAGQFIRTEFFDPNVWFMTSEVQFDGTPVLTGNDFSDWIAGYSVGGQTGIDQDPDLDGVDSGVENFFGTAPDEFTQGLVSAGADTGAGTFTFTHPHRDPRQACS